MSARHSFKPMTTELSPRERELVELSLQGLTWKEAAAQLGMAYKTAQSWWRRIYEKRGCHTVAGVLAGLWKQGLISSELKVLTNEQKVKA
jgi:DNA-binding CsgD family transcriptional regulator